MEGRYYDYTIWNNGDPRGEVHGHLPRDYSTDVIGAKALHDIATTPGRSSLFAFVSFYGVHAPTTPAPRHLQDPDCAKIRPWHPSSYNEKDVTDKPAYVQARPLLTDPGYGLVATCRTLLAVDQWVGAVRAELEESSRFDNTLFVLTSDNGMNAGAHRLLAKSTPYATQVPFFMSWRNGLGGTARRFSQRVSNIDLAPTICDFAGCSMGPYPNGQQHPDGRSFARVLTGDRASMGRDALVEDMPAGRTTSRRGTRPRRPVGRPSQASGARRRRRAAASGTTSSTTPVNASCTTFRTAPAGGGARVSPE